MTHRHTLVVVSVAVAMLVAPTIMAGETATATRNTTNESGETAGMGAQVTAFTQSSSTAMNDSVENGMWKAGFNQSNASERAPLVQNRTGTLEQRLDRLQRQNESLTERYENDSIPEPAYLAQQSRLSARIDSLQTAINDTDEAAAQAGVNDSRLERLRQNASELKGPEVAAIARGLGGGPPAERGPPEDRGERGQSAGEGDRGATENRTNGPDRTGGNAANETDKGSSGGNSSAGETDGESGSQAGSGGGDNRAGGGQGSDNAPGRSKN
ncbi:MULTISPECIES: DUF7096 domain-containing protein [Haloarcula]|uniref:DUF7096 domain-containing protein n=1 Tax=Haloarcula TaxID=2237 RepID=UPI0023E82F27|nr:hypothetical protein [Halomicroarcula sp. SHR3]